MKPNTRKLQNQPAEKMPEEWPMVLINNSNLGEYMYPFLHGPFERNVRGKNTVNENGFYQPGAVGVSRGYDGSGGAPGNTKKTNWDVDVVTVQLILDEIDRPETIGYLFIRTPGSRGIVGQGSTLSVGTIVKCKNVESGLQKRETVTRAAIHIGTVFMTEDDDAPGIFVKIKYRALTVILGAGKGKMTSGTGR